MFVQAYFIPYQHTSLHYLHGGSGNRLLFCFHGFGESAEHFKFLEKHLDKEFTIIAIDLPFHGNSRWNKLIDFDPASLVDCIEAIKLKHGFVQKKYEVLGYSMGGRVSLALLEVASDKIEKIILLAPDGLKVNFWYWMATQTSIGNKLFSITINNPKPFLFIVKLINRAGMLNQSIHKYVQVHLHNQETRKQLYQRWTCLRKFRPNLSAIKKEVLEKKTEVVLLYGKHDRIILPNRGEQFSDSIHPHGLVQILDCGHRLLEEKNATPIASHLLK